MGRLAIRVGMIVLALGLAAGARADGSRRVALVIANAHYSNANGLKNPTNDAVLVVGALKRAGFATIDSEADLTNGALRDALRRFSAAAAGADVAVIYYAGHGIEARGTNWLLPVDATLQTDSDLDYEAVNLELALRATSGARMRMVVLDACRDNPFGRSWGSEVRAVSQGLGEIKTDDVLVIYSAAPGQTAMDGVGANSPFAEALARRLPEPGMEIHLLGGKVRDDVLKLTAGRQRPYVSASISGEPFVFVDGPANVTVVRGGGPPPPAFDPRSTELAFWNSVSASNDATQLNAYLSQYPGGSFAAIARAKVAALNPPARVSAATVGPRPPAHAGSTGNDVVLDFGSIDTMSAPGHSVAADPYLHGAPIAVAVSHREPADSVMVFVNNMAVYGGQALAPTVSQNFLLQQNTGNKPASFTLALAEPVERVTFMIPKVFPATESGVTFPAWRAVALSKDGQELSSVSEQLLRRFADFPAQTYTLNAPGFEGIVAVRFDSDPRLNGVPFAGFSTIVLESLTLTRKADPAR
jgi:hypothetical protein